MMLRTTHCLFTKEVSINFIRRKNQSKKAELLKTLLRDIVTVSLGFPLIKCIPFAKNLFQNETSRKMYLPILDIPEANLR